MGDVARETRRSDLRRRLITAAMLSLAALVLLVGCAPGGSATRQSGSATVRFDGIPVGEGSIYSHNVITCRRESDVGGPTLIERRDRLIGGYQEYDWRPKGGGPKASLRLEMTPVRAAASVEFSIGSAVYSSGTATKVEPGWREGRAVFRDIPLVSGDPYRGKSSLKRLVVEWRCARYQPDA